MSCVRTLSAQMRRTIAIAFALLLVSAVPPSARADAGILLPHGQNQPNPAVLSLDEMEITIRIDNGDARIFIRQVFANHTAEIEEGTYVFALPTEATVSDFAVWDGPIRIPAVILERKRAQEIYNALALQAIDPGLLENGERGAEEASRSSIFSAKVAPIPAYGTKRVEIEYHQRIRVENLKTLFALPLHPDAYQVQAAKHVWIHFSMDSAYAIRNFAGGGKIFPLKYQRNDAHHVTGEFEGTNVNFTEDFSVGYELDAAKDSSTHVITYRDTAATQTSPTEMAPEQTVGPVPGFFETGALVGGAKVGQQPIAATDMAGPRTVVALFDASLSMQWDKLDRSYLALDHLLHSLRARDHFNLILFNSEVAAFQPAAVAADPATIQKALDFVRASYLKGGTDLERALDTGLKQFTDANAGENYLVLISDGGATRGHVRTATIAATYAKEWNALEVSARPKTYVFAVGDDANMPLLKLLAGNQGVLEQVLSTEPADFKLESFLAKIGNNPASDLRLDTNPSAAVKMVYPLQTSAYAGSLAQWVGQYDRPQKGVVFDVRGSQNGKNLDMRTRADLPAEETDHPQLPRLWARARVDALLEKMARDGEDTASIEEIIRLSRQYKFVTPYTSFLAAPRALLRPRVIRPGDPILRVKTDSSIQSVIALFPFGLMKPLRYLEGEDVWETRFLAPEDMRDGTYEVRLILRDRQGATYREAKTFVISTTSPTVQIKLEHARVQRGGTLKLKVSSSRNTRTLIARLEGAGAVELHWNQQASASIGDLEIPAELPIGKYRLTVTAEDIAHNTGSQEIEIEVLP